MAFSGQEAGVQSRGKIGKVGDKSRMLMTSGGGGGGGAGNVMLGVSWGMQLPPQEKIKF